jgi:hypothetical protein
MEYTKEKILEILDGDIESKEFKELKDNSENPVLRDKLLEIKEDFYALPKVNIYKTLLTGIKIATENKSIDKQFELLTS